MIMKRAAAPTTDRASSLRISLCGTLRVEAGGVRVDKLLVRRQARLLLALLVLTRERPSPRRELIEALWPDSMPDQPEGSLRVLLSVLRRALGDGALVGRTSVQLVLPDHAWVDVEHAKASLEHARAAVEERRWPQATDSAAEAAEFLGRPLLAGETAPWIDEARENLEELHVEALHIRATAELQTGRAREAERAARALVERTPFRETGHRLLMEALALGGNVAEALLAYERLRELLRDELGSAPSAAIAKLHARLLREEETAGTFSDNHMRQPMLPMPLDHPLSTPFVGRKRELEAILASGRVAGGGTRQAVFVSGEPGIGKTRLACEVANHLRRDGALVLYGRCDEQALTAYQPFVEAIEQYVAGCPPSLLVEQLAGFEAGELLRLVPELATRVPGLHPTADHQAAGDRYRLFGAVVNLLTRAGKGGQAPLLLVLEDLHWADQSTLLLLRHLLRSPVQAHLLVLANYRSTDTPADHPLPEMLADLGRDRLIERIALDGLTATDVGQLLDEVADMHMPSWLPHAVHSESAGNPLYVHEIARHLREIGPPALSAGEKAPHERSIEGLGVPEGVKEVIGGRLARLRRPTNEVLAAASVVGREFSMDVLERCCGLSEEALIEALEEALAAHVIEETSPGGRFTFSHTLVRATLYEQLSAVRRLRLHRLAGEALEQLQAQNLDAHLPELARHFLAAGGAGANDRAVEYSLRAGDRAQEQLALESAATHYEAALAALPPEADERRLQPMLALAQTRWRAGDFEASREAYGEAAAIARRLGRVDEFAIAALGFGGRMAFGTGVFDEPLIELLEAALAVLGEEPGALRARVMARLAEALTFCDAEGRRGTLCEQAIELAQQLDDPAVLANVLTNAHWALWSPDNPRERLAMADEIVELADRAGDSALAVDGRLWRVSDLLELGAIERADQELETWARLAEEIGHRYELWTVGCVRVLRTLMRGRVNEAEAQAARVLELGQRDRNQNALQIYGVQLAAVRREQGRYHELEDGIKLFMEQYPAIRTWRCALAYLYADAGRAQEARGELDVLGADEFAALHRDLFWLADVTLLGQACALIADVEHARVLYRQLLPYARRNVIAAAIAACWGSTSRTVALLAVTLGRFDEAGRHFEDAIEMNGAIGARTWQERSRVEYAQMLLARGQDHDRARAQRLLEEASAAARELELFDIRDRAEAALAATFRPHAAG